MSFFRESFFFSILVTQHFKDLGAHKYVGRKSNVSLPALHAVPETPWDTTSLGSIFRPLQIETSQNASSCVWRTQIVSGPLVNLF